MSVQFGERERLEYVHVGNDKELDDSRGGQDEAVVGDLLAQVL